MNPQIESDIVYGIVGVVVALLGVFTHSKFKARVPKGEQPFVSTVETVTTDVVDEVRNLVDNGKNAVVAHDLSVALKETNAAKVEKEVNQLILQYAGAAGKTVTQLTEPDLQNVIAFVLTSLSPVDKQTVDTKTIVKQHQALVEQTKKLSDDPVFQASQVAAAYQESAKKEG